MNENTRATDRVVVQPHHMEIVHLPGRAGGKGWSPAAECLDLTFGRILYGTKPQKNLTPSCLLFLFQVFVNLLKEF